MLINDTWEVKILNRGKDLTHEILDGVPFDSEQDLIDYLLDYKYARNYVHHSAYNTAPDDKVITCNGEEVEDDDMEDYQIQSLASVLYDGGWRREDREDMIIEYQLSARDADHVIEMFDYYDSKNQE